MRIFSRLLSPNEIRAHNLFIALLSCTAEMGNKQPSRSTSSEKQPTKTCGWTTDAFKVPDGWVAPTYIVNLDDDPTNRWKQIGRVYKKEIKEIFEEIKKTLPEGVFPLVGIFGKELDSLLPPPYPDELRGLAEVTGIPVGELFLFQLAYDITAYCSSVVARSCEGKLLHGRNLDMPAEAALQAILPATRKATLTVDFQRARVTVYSGVVVAGQIGLFTGQKPHSFTITINERRQGSFLINILHLLRDHPGSALGFLVRDALADPDINYQGALNRLMYVPMIASCYVIIAGTKPGEGAVISRKRMGPVKPLSDGVWKLPGGDSNNPWYLWQSNNDHWTRPPDIQPGGGNASSTDSYQRQVAGKEAMNEMGQSNLSPQNLIETDRDALSVYPVLGPHTWYSIIMTAAEPSLMKTWVRDKPEPTQQQRA